MIGAAIVAAAERLKKVSETPRLDAELLVAHLLNVERADLLLRHLDDPVPEGFDALVSRRLEHEPIAYIVGERDFWTITLKVGPGVLIPRPDSETLIEAAIAHFDGAAPANILDMGTGPGTLLLAALDTWPEANGVGVDQSEQALEYARRNAAALGMAPRTRFSHGDWATGIEGSFDLILCNPPYIGVAEPLPDDVGAYEPSSALFAGADGLDDYRRIIPDLRRLMAPGAVAILEIGWTQDAAVSALGREAGFSVEMRRDLAARPRAILLS